MVRFLQALCLCMFLPLVGVSEQVSAERTVTFTLDFPQSQPEHYSIEIHGSGKARYQSRGRISSESEDTDSFSLDFSVSATTREKIFDLAARSKYFEHDLDSHRKNMAFTGKKTLTYKDAERNGESSYNYSPDPAVQELTTLLQGLSATLETGHRLEYDHRYQKLALEQELKRTEEMARTTPPVELQAIAPILQRIVNDPSVINVTRARAQRLLARGVAGEGQ